METRPDMEYVNELPFLMNFQEMNPRIVTVEGAYDASLQCWAPAINAHGSSTGTGTSDTSGGGDSDSD